MCKHPHRPDSPPDPTTTDTYLTTSNTDHNYTTPTGLNLNQTRDQPNDAPQEYNTLTTNSTTDNYSSPTMPDIPHQPPTLVQYELSTHSLVQHHCPPNKPPHLSSSSNSLPPPPITASSLINSSDVSLATSRKKHYQVAKDKCVNSGLQPTPCTRQMTLRISYPDHFLYCTTTLSND